MQKAPEGAGGKQGGQVRMRESGIPAYFDALASNDGLTELHQLIRASLDPRFRDFLALPPGELSSDKSVVVGHAGHLFVNDGSNSWRMQLSGQAIIDESAEASTRESLDGTEARLREMGIFFTLVVYPEKDIIYPELSPNVSGFVHPVRSIHRIQTDRVRAVYPDKGMIESRKRLEVFHRRNSHVNFYGGLVAANHVLDAMRLEPLEFDDVPSDLVNWPDDLSIKWVDNFLTLRRRVKPVFARETVRAPEGGGHVGTVVVARNEAALSNARIIIFGDSYAWNPDAGLLSFLALRAKEVYMLWQKSIDWAMVAEVKPTHVILQSAERFLIRGLPK